MVFGLHFFRSDDTLYNTFFINDESCAERSHIFAAIHAFFAPYSELFYQLLVGVCNQGKRQIVFCLLYTSDAADEL